MTGKVKIKIAILRPSAVDTNDLTSEETIGIGILDVGDIPPDFFCASKNGRDGREESRRGEGRGRGPHDERGQVDRLQITGSSGRTI